MFGFIKENAGKLALAATVLIGAAYVVNKLIGDDDDAKESEVEPKDQAE